MPESFEMFRYLDHLRRRWPVVAGACGVAAGLACVVALLLPAEYTATTRILIEPPIGGDAHASMAVSPIYLESLRTYEVLASGDRMFADAINHFHLQRRKPIDRLKRSVLQVKLARNTKVLEISATLPDARQAQALAVYIAEQTVKLTRDVAAEADRDALADAEKQWDEARTRLESPEGAKARPGARTADSRSAGPADISPLQLALEAAQIHLGEVRSAAGYRGERLKIVDPGVVPERPFWPNIPLTVLAALALALAGSMLFLTFEFNYRLASSAAPRAPAPLARVKTRND